MITCFSHLDEILKLGGRHAARPAELHAGQLSLWLHRQRQAAGGDEFFFPLGINDKVRNADLRSEKWSYVEKQKWGIWGMCNTQTKNESTGKEWWNEFPREVTLKKVTMIGTFCALSGVAAYGSSLHNWKTCANKSILFARTNSFHNYSTWFQNPSHHQIHWDHEQYQLLEFCVKQSGKNKLSMKFVPNEERQEAEVAQTYVVFNKAARTAMEIASNRLPPDDKTWALQPNWLNVKGKSILTIIHMKNVHDDAECTSWQIRTRTSR